MAFSETFHSNSGFQLSFEGKSLLLQMTGVAQRFSRRQREDFSTIAADLFSELGSKPSNRVATAKSVHAREFPEVEGEVFKIVTREAEGYLRGGSFRLGSPTYYASLGADARTDGWEGYTALFADYRDETFFTAVTTGYNCLAFCTTRARDRSRLRQLRDKFGGPDGRVIRITDIQGLAQVLAGKVRADTFSVRDVRYHDAKLIHLEAAHYETVADLLMNRPPPRDLTEALLHDLNQRFAPIIHRDALLSSLFVKPLAYAGELESRIILELPADVPAPHHVDVTAPDAVRFLEFEA